MGRKPIQNQRHIVRRLDFYLEQYRFKIEKMEANKLKQRKGEYGSGMGFPVNLMVLINRIYRTAKRVLKNDPRNTRAIFIVKKLESDTVLVENGLVIGYEPNRKGRCTLSPEEKADRIRMKWENIKIKYPEKYAKHEALMEKRRLALEKAAQILEAKRKLREEVAQFKAMRLSYFDDLEQMQLEDNRGAMAEAVKEAHDEGKQG